MRTVAKITLSCGSFLLVLIWASSCGARQNRECEKRIAQEIHVGVPVETADGVLKRCGFKTTLDVAKNTLYADKRVGWLIAERTQVLNNSGFGQEGSRCNGHQGSDWTLNFLVPSSPVTAFEQEL
jgi:hypothetical protein